MFGLGFRRICRDFALLASLLGLSGCSGFIEDRAAESTLTILKGSKIAMRRSVDLEIARSAAPGGLVQLEAFAWAYPKHRAFRTMLTEAQCQYAVGFALDDWERSVIEEGAGSPVAAARRTRSLALFERCAELSVALLGSEWEPLLKGEDISNRVAKARRKHVPAMSWLALGVANSIALDPLSPLRRKQLPMVEGILARIVELDESHDDAFAHVLLGALASSRPEFLGGNPEKGKAHFAQARELSGGASLMGEVIFARTYAVAKKDRELFVKVLKAVVAADTSRWPERRLANTLAISKAQLYLSAETKLFGERAPVSASAMADTTEGQP